MKTRNATTPIYEEPNVESKKLGTYPENILLYVNPRPSPNGFMEIFGPDHTYGFIQKDDLLLYHPKNMFTTYEFTEKPHPIIAASYEEYTDLEKFKKLDLLISCAFALLFICCLFRFFQYWNEWSESQYILLVAILFSLIFLIIAIREVYFITAEMKAYQHIEEQFPHGSIGCEPFPSKLKNIGLNNN